MTLISFNSLIPLFMMILGTPAMNAVSVEQDKIVINFEKKSAALSEAEKNKFRDLTVMRDSITGISICGYPDPKNRIGRKQRKLANRRAEVVKSYLLGLGFKEDIITIDNYKEAAGFQAATVSFTYKPPVRVQSEH